MNEVVVSVVVALLGVILFIISSRNDGFYSPCAINKYVDTFVSSAHKCLDNGCVTEQEARQLYLFIDDVKSRRNNILGQNNKSYSNFLMGALMFFPFNVFFIVGVHFNRS